jgi:hypothetical protein
LYQPHTECCKDWTLACFIFRSHEPLHTKFDLTKRAKQITTHFSMTSAFLFYKYPWHMVTFNEQKISTKRLIAKSKFRELGIIPTFQLTEQNIQRSPKPEFTFVTC